jgi:DNA-binding MarR family transcriptional regulator
LRSLSRRVTRFYDQALAPARLKVTQYSLIAHARRRAGPAGPTVSELAAALFTDRTTVTRNLRPLIDAGWLALGPGGDARSKEVLVTTAGEAAFQAARPLWRAAQARVRELAGAEQLESLHGLIDSLLPLFGAEPDDGADTPH